jgi:hypothetical protein
MRKRRGAAPARNTAPQPTKITVELILDADLDPGERRDVVRCICCARPLRAPQSVRRSLGPVCARREVAS